MFLYFLPFQPLLDYKKRVAGKYYRLVAAITLFKKVLLGAKFTAGFRSIYESFIFRFGDICIIWFEGYDSTTRYLESTKFIVRQLLS